MAAPLPARRRPLRAPCARPRTASPSTCCPAPAPTPSCGWTARRSRASGPTMARRSRRSRSTAGPTSRASSRPASRSPATTRSTCSPTTWGSRACGPTTARSRAGTSTSAAGWAGRTASPTRSRALADPLGFVPDEDLVRVAEAVVIVQRDWGDRTNRRHARLKYTIAEHGIDWFRGEVERGRGALAAADPRGAVEPRRRPAGLARAGRRRLVRGHADRERPRPRRRRRFGSAPRCARIAAEHGVGFRITPNQNLYLVDVPAAAAARSTRSSRTTAWRPATPCGASRRLAMACPALPTCGLAVTEAERTIAAVVDDLQAEFDAAGVGRRGAHRAHDRLPQRLRPAVRGGDRARRRRGRPVPALARRRQRRDPARDAGRGGRPQGRPARTCSGPSWRGTATSGTDGEAFGDWSRGPGSPTSSTRTRPGAPPPPPPRLDPSDAGARMTARDRARPRSARARLTLMPPLRAPRMPRRHRGVRRAGRAGDRARHASGASRLPLVTSLQPEGIVILAPAHEAGAPAARRSRSTPAACRPRPTT